MHSAIGTQFRDAFKLYYTTLFSTVAIALFEAYGGATAASAWHL